MKAERRTTREWVLRTLVPTVSEETLTGRALVTLWGANIGDNPLLAIHSGSEQFAELCLEADGWWVEARGGSAQLEVNGRATRAERLEVGDRIALGSMRFEFAARESSWVVQPDLERRLRASMDDVATWHVYADWLVEQGDPIGSAIARGSPSPELLGRLCELSPGALQLEWRHGVVEKARLCLSPLPRYSERAVARATLAALRTLPVARFLRSLQVELVAECPPQAIDQYPRQLEPLERTGAELVRQLEASAWPALETLELGPVWDAGLARALEPLRAGPARLRTPPRQRVAAWGSARLEGAERTVGLDRTQRTRLGDLTFSFVDGGWRLDFDAATGNRIPLAARPVRLNGHPVTTPWLTPGDVVTTPDAETWRFEARPA